MVTDRASKPSFLLAVEVGVEESGIAEFDVLDVLDAYQSCGSAHGVGA